MMTPSSTTKPSKQEFPHQIIGAYGLFIMSAGAVWALVADGAFSSILTLSVMVQCLGLVLLAVQVLTTGSISGISAQALCMQALALCCRLSSTVWLNGYLPVDASGDHIFQIIDICSLGVLGWLLQQAWSAKRETYQAADDSMPILPMCLGALILAAALHGNMNGRPVFDTLWMAGLFMNTVQLLPQLWLITHSGGHVQSLTSHYIAAMAVSNALSGIFMWHAGSDITCSPWIGEFNHASWTILAAHLLQMVLIGDFIYYYVQAVIKRGLDCSLDVMESCGV